jgi:diphthine synthase
MLYLIGLGLGNEKSISLNGLEAIKKCEKVFLECYTSRMNCDVEDLERLTGKNIIRVNRTIVEEELDLKEAKNKDIALLIVGDVFSATTHISIYNECKSKQVEVKVINNASILTAIGVVGLSLYSFGKVASIPFENSKVVTPIKILNDNKKINAHTLFLLDLKPLENKYLSVKEGIEYLERNNVKGKIVGCSRIGIDDVIKYGEMNEIKNEDFGEGPYCLILPSEKLHFVEEESLEKFKLTVP